MKKISILLMLMALFGPLAMMGQNQLLSENFDSMSSISTSYSSTDWYAYNAGNGNNWTLNTNSSYANSGSKSAQVQYNSNNAANCYLVSKPFTVNASMTALSVSLYDRSRSTTYTETYEVFFVKANDVTTNAGVVSATQYSAFSSSTNQESFNQKSGSIESSAVSALAGQSVRVVVHCTSPKDQWYLYIDDIVVTETTSGGGQGDSCDYSEDFENVSGASSGYSSAGSLPTGWDQIYAGDVNSTTAQAPHVHNGSSYPGPGTGTNALSGYYLGFYGTGNNSNSYAIMPAFAANKAASHISFKYRYENTSNGTLSYGVIDGTDASTYVVLGTCSTSSNPGLVDVDLNTSQTAGKRLAFCWYYSASSWYTAGIDDICVTTDDASNLHVTVWTETDQHAAWGTVQIGSDTPGTNVETYVEEGSQITVTATPDECHTFAYWIPNGGGNNITQNPASITVNDDLDLQAVFTAKTYNVTATPNNSSYGSVNGGGNNLECGSSCTLTATANTGYGFMGWQLNGNIVSTDNPYTITVNTNATYTAIFEIVSQHNITVTQATGGTISANPTTAYMGDMITLTATPETGYFFVEWIVEDASHNPITVTNNQFTMPNSDVTVTATFTQGFNVTLVQTANGTISANKTNNLQPGEHVTLTATPATDCVFLAWYAYKTGNPRDVVAVIANTTILMPASDVTVQAVFVTQEEHEAQLGSSEGTTAYIPTYVRANYTLTQQIYLASEMENQKGTITKIAFKAATASCTRNLTIYMAHTDKSAFGSTTNWDMMAPQQIVFEGSVEFNTSGWTTITLDTPFEYDGERNINICVVDNTGNTSGTNNTYTKFYAYNVTGYRGIVAYGSSSYASAVVNAGIFNITAQGRTQFVNQINLTMLVPGSAEALTISPDAINDFSYVEGQGPSEIHKLDIVGVDLQNNITLTAPTNFEISLTESGTYDSSLTIPHETGSKGNRTVTTWGFEGTMDGWTALDADNDGYNWIFGSASDGVYFESGSSPLESGHNSSTDMLVSGSWTDAVPQALTPDNWLISPQVQLGGAFSMWAKPEHTSYTAEHFGIYVSTTGTNPSDFTEKLGEWTLSSPTWKQFTVDLGLFTGQTGYIAVRHFGCTDQYLIDVDDFMLDTEATITIEMPVTITPATVFVRMKDNLNAGTYSGTLTASAGTGDNLNRSVSLSGEVIAAYNITLTANPTEGGAVAGAGSYAAGTSVTVSARPLGNYDPEYYGFINWTENGTVVSTDASYTFTVNADRALVANFGFIKHITAFYNADGTTINGGYYLIASPIGTVDPEDATQVTNMITPKENNKNTYDLYGFDQAEEYEWRNYRQGAFDLVAGKGYLYGNSNDVDLIFTGSAISGTTYTVQLTKAEAATGLDFPDWNLVGNPFPVVAYIPNTKPYYKMNAGANEIISITGNSVQPMEGVFVVATSNNEELTFSTTNSNGKGSNLSLNLTEGGTLIDRAIVSFVEGEQLPKFQLNRNSTKLYIPQDGHDYAVVRSEEMGAMPVNFKAENNGTYSLSFSSENAEFAYLHLIDNMTGRDIDLLQTPSYSFEAKTTDYESRFKLVFATGDNSTSDTFAFFSNGSFVINNDGIATLQVIDITGRILKSESINGCANVNVSAAPGVYMLRLINGTDVKVQKVVVK